MTSIWKKASNDKKNVAWTEYPPHKQEIYLFIFCLVTRQADIPIHYFMKLKEGYSSFQASNSMQNLQAWATFSYHMTNTTNPSIEHATCITYNQRTTN
jgi:hypothetical protein